MDKKSIWRLSFCAAVGTVVLLGWTLPANATHEVVSCNDFCATNCSGQGSNCRTAVSGSCLLSPGPSGVLVCNAGEGPIHLKDGTDLDMHGHTIKCADGVDCGDAIVMDSTGSSVYNGVSTSEAVITGGFIIGVNCGAFNNTSVIGIKISKVIMGIANCKTVLNNVVRDLGRTYLAANWGIYTVGITASGDDIRDNYIEGRLYGIQIDGTTKPTVQNNVIHTTHYGSCGIRLTNSGSQAKLLDNTVLGTGNAGFTGVRKVICLPSPAPTAAQFSGNLCDEDHPDCIPCTQTLVGSSNVCVPMTAPYLP
jgi:hypothetical protein